MGARCFVLKVFLFVPLLLFVAAVNISVDPAGLYRNKADDQGSDEYRLVQALVTGRAMTVAGPIDDRLVQKYLIENLTSAPQVVVLGSSDSIWLGENIFSPKKTMNNSVLLAALADYLGIFEEYAKRKLYPQRVICLLNPQLIMYPVFSENWVSISENTYSMLNRLGVRSEKFQLPVIPQAWPYIFSLTYFQRSMRVLWGQHQKLTCSVNKEVTEGDTLLKDGRRLLGKELSARGLERKRRVIRGPYYGKLYQVNLDKELEDILEKFIRYLMNQHIQVTLCMLPVHPHLYQSYLESQKGQGILDLVAVEQYYRSLAKRLNLEIVGSYNPAACNLDSQDFYDGDHIRNDVIERIFKQPGSVCSMSGL